MSAEQAALDFDPRSWAGKRSDEYRASLAQQARATGLRAARVGDPDGHAQVIRTIRELLSAQDTATADDVQAVMPIRSKRDRCGVRGACPRWRDLCSRTHHVTPPSSSWSDPARLGASLTDYSRGDMSYAVRLANRGYDADMIFRALAQKPSGRREPGSLKYQRLLDTKGRDAADAYARSTASKAVAFVTDNPRITDRTDALVRLIEVRALADAMPWGLYAGPGARRALEAAFHVAERIGGLSFGLSLREWAEICGQDLRTTRTHRDLLVRLGWLLRNPDDRLGRTARFRLRTPSHIHSHGRYECAASGGAAWLAHDAFRPDGLGDLGWYVLGLTESRPTLHELSIRAGVDRVELEDVIGIMFHADLVVGVDQVERVADPIPALDRIAERRGTLGLGAADRDQHQRDREAFRARGVNVRTPQEAR